MDEHLPLHWISKGAVGDSDPPAKPAEEDEMQAGGPSLCGEIVSGGDIVDDSRKFWRGLKEQRRAQLRAKVDSILRETRTPLRDIVRDHVLPLLPVHSLLRFSSVSADWRRMVSAPLFRHTQSHTHRSASGVFWQLLPGVPSYSPFDPLAGGVPYASLDFLPCQPGVAVLASSRGLLCCAGLLNSFYVCNPTTAEWTPLPEPPPPRLPYRDGLPVVDDWRTAVALVFQPSVANLEADYHLIRPVEVSGDCEGVYGFQVFSSCTGAWRLSSDVCATENLIHGSGISAGGVAYWRTTMQTVVAYDPATDRCRLVAWPMGYDTTAQWQLGEMDGRLCCTCVTDSAVEVYALAAGDRWSLLACYRVGEKDCEQTGGLSVVFRSRPWPLRFQSGDLEVLLWVADRVVGLDVAIGRVRKAYVAPGGPWMNPWAEYVPHMSTIAPVFPSAVSSSGVRDSRTVWLRATRMARDLGKYGKRPSQQLHLEQSQICWGRLGKCSFWKEMASFFSPVICIFIFFFFFVFVSSM